MDAVTIAKKLAEARKKRGELYRYEQIWGQAANMSADEIAACAREAKDRHAELRGYIRGLELIYDSLTKESPANGTEPVATDEVEEKVEWTAPPTPEGYIDLYDGRKTIRGENRRWLFEQMQDWMIESERLSFSYEEIRQHVWDSLKVFFRGSRRTRPKTEFRNLLGSGVRLGFFRRVDDGYGVGEVAVPSKERFAKHGSNWQDWSAREGKKDPWQKEARGGAA